MDPLSPELLREFLPPDTPATPPFSFLHPGALFLFSERLSYRVVDGPAGGRLLIAVTNDGAVFLPLPPLPFFDPGICSRDRGALLARIFSDLSARFPASPPPFLENCPAALAPEGAFLSEAGEREIVLAASTICAPRGNPGRIFRWEGNRLERLLGPVQVRRIGLEEGDAVRALIRDFSGHRRTVARDSLEREMASDMERAFERAMDPEGGDSLEGWRLDGRGGLLAAGWYGRSPSGRVLAGFLEARRADVSNVGALMMRKILEAEGGGKETVAWVNIGGGSGIGGVERAKKSRPHDLVLPLIRILPR